MNYDSLCPFLSASVLFGQLLSAYVGICRYVCRYMSAWSVYVGMYVGVCRHGRYMSAWSVYVGICRHMSAFVGLSAYVGLVGICRLWSAYVGFGRHMSAYVGFGRHMSAFWSAYVGICRHMSVSGVGGGGPFHSINLLHSSLERIKTGLLFGSFLFKDELVHFQQQQLSLLASSHQHYHI